MKKLATLFLVGALLFAFSAVTFAVPKSTAVYKTEKTVSKPELVKVITDHFSYAREHKTAGLQPVYSIGKTAKADYTLNSVAIIPEKLCLATLHRQYPRVQDDGKYDNRLLSYNQRWQQFNISQQRQV